MIIAFVRSNSNILWVIRDCMSSQQLVDFIREHIDTVSTKQFNTICPFKNCSTIFGLPWGFLWQLLMLMLSWPYAFWKLNELSPFVWLGMLLFAFLVDTCSDGGLAFLLDT